MAIRRRPSRSIVASLKSSRLREISAPPLSQIGPRCTGSFGVALTVVHVLPPSYVVAMNRYQRPSKDEELKLPDLSVPRKPHDARPGSPATASGKTAWTEPTDAPMSWSSVHVWPRS